MEVSSAVLEARRKLKEKMKGGTVQVGGRGSVRRKVKQKVEEIKSNITGKLDVVLKKLGATDFGEIDEAYIFTSNGAEYIGFKNPKVYGVVKSSTFVIAGESEKNLADVASIFKGLNEKAEAMGLEKEVLDKIKEAGLQQLNDGIEKEEDVEEEKTKKKDKKTNNDTGKTDQEDKASKKETTANGKIKLEEKNNTIQKENEKREDQNKVEKEGNEKGAEKEEEEEEEEKIPEVVEDFEEFADEK